MTRQIACAKCSTYLGVIRDAMLRKGIVYLCNVCGAKPKPPKTPNAADVFNFLHNAMNENKKGRT
jgi:hypothetical protein